MLRATTSTAGSCRMLFRILAAAARTRLSFTIRRAPSIKEAVPTTSNEAFPNSCGEVDGRMQVVVDDVTRRIAHGAKQQCTAPHQHASRYRDRCAAGCDADRAEQLAGGHPGRAADRARDRLSQLKPEVAEATRSVPISYTPL